MLSGDIAGALCVLVGSGKPGPAEEIRQSVHAATGQLGRHIKESVGSVKEEMVGGLSAMVLGAGEKLEAIDLRLKQMECVLTTISSQVPNLVTKKDHAALLGLMQGEHVVFDITPLDEDAKANLERAAKEGRVHVASS